MRDLDRNSDYQTIIRRVLAGELAPDPEGVVELPRELASATANGKVYYSRSDRGVAMIALATWIGKGYNMQGYLYASELLGSGEIFKDYYGNDSVIVGPTELVLMKRLSDHWYSVSRSLD